MEKGPERKPIQGTEPGRDRRMERSGLTKSIAIFKDTKKSRSSLDSLSSDTDLIARSVAFDTKSGPCTRSSRRSKLPVINHISIVNLGTIIEYPEARMRHTTVCYEKQLYIYGGSAGNNIYLDSIETLDLNSPSPKFKKIVAKYAPEGRHSHTAVLQKHNMIIFGGMARSGASNDFYSLDLLKRKKKWVKIDSSGDAPSPRSGHSAVVHGNAMYIFGGEDGLKFYNDFFKFSFTTNTWSSLPVGPTARRYHSSAVSGDMLFICGGVSSGESKTFDLWGYNISTRMWTPFAVPDDIDLREWPVLLASTDRDPESFSAPLSIGRSTSLSSTCTLTTNQQEKERLPCLYVHGGSFGDLKTFDITAKAWIPVSILDQSKASEFCRQYHTVTSSGEVDSKGNEVFWTIGGFSQSGICNNAYSFTVSRTISNASQRYHRQSYYGVMSTNSADSEQFRRSDSKSSRSRHSGREKRHMSIDEGIKSDSGLLLTSGLEKEQKKPDVVIQEPTPSKEEKATENCAEERPATPMREWLRRHNLENTADIFESEEFNLETLLSLTEQDMLDLNLKMGIRKQLMSAIASETGVKDVEEVSYLKDVQKVKIIGKGAFGAVYEGLWESTTPVAMKIMFNPADREFVNELTLLKSLRHPNCVFWYGIYQEGNERYICTEFLPLGSLDKFLRKTPTLSVHDLLYILIGASAGMKYLSVNNIIHRDLAARNLLVKRADFGGYTVKVSDFGLSRSAESGTYESTNNTFPIKWTAPEAIQSSMYSSKSDVWSYGVVMWETFEFGKLPYYSLSNKETIKYVEEGHRLEEPKILEAHSLGKEIYGMMNDCWKTEPEQRPTFNELHKGISELFLRDDTKFSVPTTSDPPEVIGSQKATSIGEKKTCADVGDSGDAKDQQLPNKTFDSDAISAEQSYCYGQNDAADEVSRQARERYGY